MRKPKRLSGVSALVVSEEPRSEAAICELLESQEAVIHRLGPMLNFDCCVEVAILDIRALSAWSFGVLSTLRASTYPCATIALLDEREPQRAPERPNARRVGA